MIKIRLARLGAKKKPIYRVVVADVRNARNNGRPIATIGQYDPAKETAQALTVDTQAALEWLGKGAQPTDTIRSLFKKAGIMAQPEAVTVTKIQKADLEVYRLHVAPDDMGKVIGKQGKIARALRLVVKAAAVRADVKVAVDIV